MSVNDIVQSYGSAWNTADEGERRALLEKAWADDGVYQDPMGRAEGRDALVAHISGFREQMPGNSIVLTTGVDQHGNVLRFGWEMQGPDGAALMDGVDFGVLADDGRLASITGFFGPLPAQE